MKGVKGGIRGLPQKCSSIGWSWLGDLIVTLHGQVKYGRHLDMFESLYTVSSVSGPGTSEEIGCPISRVGIGWEREVPLPPPPSQSPRSVTLFSLISSKRTLSPHGPRLIRNSGNPFCPPPACLQSLSSPHTSLSKVLLLTSSSPPALTMFSPSLYTSTAFLILTAPNPSSSSFHSPT